MHSGLYAILHSYWDKNMYVCTVKSRNVCGSCRQG